MIYLLASVLSTFYGIANGLGSVTLLRPLLDIISPLQPESIALLCTMAALCASLICAFFALNHPLPFQPDDLLLLAVGGALGGVLGDLAASRFLTVLPKAEAVFLQNALLLILVALPLLYFKTLSPLLRPLGLSGTMVFPVAAVIGLLASFLAFGAEPLSLMLFFYLFDARNDEASAASLTITLCAMGGKLIIMLIRMRFSLPDADVLLWLLPGAVLGTLLAMVPRIQHIPQRSADMLLKLSLFTSLLNVAASAMG